MNDSFAYLGWYLDGCSCDLSDIVKIKFYVNQPQTDVEVRPVASGGDLMQIRGSFCSVGTES